MTFRKRGELLSKSVQPMCTLETQIHGPERGRRVLNCFQNRVGTRLLQTATYPSHYWLRAIGRPEKAGHSLTAHSPLPYGCLAHQLPSKSISFLPASFGPSTPGGHCRRGWSLGKEQGKCFSLSAQISWALLTLLQIGTYAPEECDKHQTLFFHPRKPREMSALISLKNK